MQILFKKTLKYPVLISLLLFIIYLLKRYENQSTGGTDDDVHLTRDYILSDNVITKTYEKINTHRPNTIYIYKRPLNKDITGEVQKTLLKTMKGNTPIYVHSAKDDNMISARVKEYGTWEEDLLNQTGYFLLNHPGITFIDIGCNLGVYSLFAAKLSVDIISVDPVKRNLDLLSLSLDAGDLAENVTLVLNALSDEYKKVLMDIPKDNIGGAHIVNNIKHKTMSREVEVETILLDDIIPYIKRDSVFIKMDVEGHEWNVLKGSRNIFQTKDIKGILMEWVHHRGQKNGEMIVNYLSKNGFLPYDDIYMKQLLDPESYYMWPENIFWTKR